MNISQSNFNNFESEIIKMPSISDKRILSDYDYGAIFASKLKKSLSNGTSPFLPNKDGIVKGNGVYNLQTNKLHTGISQLMLKERQFELGSDSCAFVSSDSIEIARKNGVDVLIRKGEHGFDMHFKSNTNGEDKVIKWFNESQLLNAENLREYYKQRQNLNAKQKQLGLDKFYPGKIAKNASLETHNHNNKIFECTAKTPEEYLGQVFACMTYNCDMKVSEVIKEMFLNNTIALLNKEYKPGVINKLAIFKLASKANKLREVYEKAIKLEINNHNTIKQKYNISKKRDSYERERR